MKGYSISFGVKKENKFPHELNTIIVKIFDNCLLTSFPFLFGIQFN